jgi:hypothetical protein
MGKNSVQDGEAVYAKFWGSRDAALGHLDKGRCGPFQSSTWALMLGF